MGLFHEVIDFKMWYGVANDFSKSILFGYPLHEEGEEYHDHDKIERYYSSQRRVAL